jgi:hypothetical protein
MIRSKDKKIRKIAEDYGQSIGVHFFKVNHILEHLQRDNFKLKA